MICKLCNGSNLVKSGTERGIQRYKCKCCNKTFILGDKRIKYSLEKRLKVIKMYLEGVGIRSIERLAKVSNTLIIYWIRCFSKLVGHDISFSLAAI